MRIFSAEQINVPEELPTILKNYSKEVIRNNPPDIIKFSRQYYNLDIFKNYINKYVFLQVNANSQKIDPIEKP